MRYVLAFWALPLVLFWGWYFLSLNNIHFGYVLLTRQAHDLLFALYGDMIGVDGSDIPRLVAKACVFDTVLLMALCAFRRRKAIASWFSTLRDAIANRKPHAGPSAGRVLPGE